MCGCTEPKRKTISPQQVAAGNGNGTDAMVRIEYVGPAGQHPVVGTATRQNYGRRAGGDTFYVYAKDQADTPERFVIIADLAQVIAPTPVPPEPPLRAGVLA